MCPFRLRTALPSDLPGILDLFRETVRKVNSRDYDARQIEVWAGGSRNQAWRERIERQYFLLAETPDGLAGFASLTDGGYLDTLYVHHARQGQGVASLLAAKLVHRAYGRGLPLLQSDVSITAQPFFSRMGFVTTHPQDKELRGVVFRNYRMERPLPPPVLETDRMLLKPFGPEDAWDFYLLNADQEVIRHTGDHPFTDLREAADFLAGYDQYRRHGYGRWAVLRRDDAQYLGWCGLKYHPDSGETDLGFRFYRCYWNRGYATEAARACLDYGFRRLGLRRVIGRAFQANAASIRVLEKCGMRLREEVDFAGNPGVIYEQSPA